jgi:hypothetical protein
MWFAFLLPVAPVNIPPSDGNVQKYMPCAFKHIYAISHIAMTFVYDVHIYDNHYQDNFTRKL